MFWSFTKPWNSIRNDSRSLISWDWFLTPTQGLIFSPVSFALRWLLFTGKVDFSTAEDWEWSSGISEISSLSDFFLSKLWNRGKQIRGWVEGGQNRVSLTSQTPLTEPNDIQHQLLAKKPYMGSSVFCNWEMSFQPHQIGKNAEISSNTVQVVHPETCMNGFRWTGCKVRDERVLLQLEPLWMEHHWSCKAIQKEI